jgi:hypothetical protein
MKLMMLLFSAALMLPAGAMDMSVSFGEEVGSSVLAFQMSAKGRVPRKVVEKDSKYRVRNLEAGPVWIALEDPVATWDTDYFAVFKFKAADGGKVRLTLPKDSLKLTNLKLDKETPVTLVKVERMVDGEADPVYQHWIYYRRGSTGRWDNMAGGFSAGSYRMICREYPADGKIPEGGLGPETGRFLFTVPENLPESGKIEIKAEKSGEAAGWLAMMPIGKTGK